MLMTLPPENQLLVVFYTCSDVNYLFRLSRYVSFPSTTSTFMTGHSSRPSTAPAIANLFLWNVNSTAIAFFASGFSPWRMSLACVACDLFPYFKTLCERDYTFSAPVLAYSRVSYRSIVISSFLLRCLWNLANVTSSLSSYYYSYSSSSY